MNPEAHLIRQQEREAAAPDPQCPHIAKLDAAVAEALRHRGSAAVFHWAVGIERRTWRPHLARQSGPRPDSLRDRVFGKGRGA